MAKPDVSVSTGRGSGKVEEQMGASSDSPKALKDSEYVTAWEGGMLISRCSRSAAQRRAYGMWLEQVQRQCGSEEEFATAISKPSWTQVAPFSSCSGSRLSSALAEGGSWSCLSAAEKCKIQVTNEQFFQELIKKQPPPEPRGRPWNPGALLEWEMVLKTSAFFTDFEGRVEVGKRIAQGGQAEIYEALFDGKEAVDSRSPPSLYVLKVFALEHSELFRHAWAKDLDLKYNELRADGTCCFIDNCTLLKDGRFAFLMKRYWGDLRKAINVQILKDKTHLRPPFPPSISICIMCQIAQGMQSLHYNGTLHRDLKADNVLVTMDIETSYFFCHVADFESAEGVMGTGFWRAPEVLGILRSSSKDKYSDPSIWTEKVDVYAYGMTCYEILSGCIPFHTRAANDYDIGDERPLFPDHVDHELQELVRKCWDSEPSKRPTFQTILEDLQTIRRKKIAYSEALAEDDRDDEAKRWLNWGYRSVYGSSWVFSCCF